MLFVVWDLRQVMTAKIDHGIFVVLSVKTQKNHCINADSPFQVFLCIAFAARADFLKVQIAIAEIP